MSGLIYNCQNLLFQGKKKKILTYFIIQKSVFKNEKGYCGKPHLLLLLLFSSFLLFQVWRAHKRHLKNIKLVVCTAYKNNWITSRDAIKTCILSHIQFMTAYKRVTSGEKVTHCFVLPDLLVVINNTYHKGLQSDWHSKKHGQNCFGHLILLPLQFWLPSHPVNTSSLLLSCQYLCNASNIAAVHH